MHGSDRTCAGADAGRFKLTNTNEVRMTPSRRCIITLACALISLTTLGISTPNTYAYITATGDVDSNFSGHGPWEYYKLYVGKTRSGTLLVDDGSDIKSYKSYIGYEPGSVGTVTIMVPEPLGKKKINYMWDTTATAR